MTRALLVALVVAFVPDAGAGLHFERVSSPSGPPSGVITALAQDREGLLWIGTISGVSRYDGHTFTSWSHDPSDPDSLSDDALRTILEDSRGDLWIGTNTGGLNRLDRATGRFQRFRHDSADPSSLSHDSVYAVAEDPSGALWVGTQRGLNRLDRGTGKFERFLADEYVSALLRDAEGTLWVGTVQGGLLRWDPTGRTFRRLRHDPADPGSLGNDGVFALLEHPRGVLWIGTNDGLDRMETAALRFTHHPYCPGSPMGPSYPIVSSLAPADGGKLWAGTFGGGLDLFDPATGTFRAHRHDPSIPGALPANRVIALLSDREGALWIATFGGGLCRVSASAHLFADGVSGLDAPPDLEDRDVTAVAVDAHGGLWVGTRSGVLLRRGADSGVFRRVPLDRPGSVLRILPDEGETVWVSSALRLSKVEATRGQTARIVHDPRDPSSLGPGFVTALLRGRDGTFWVGTGEGGLQQLGQDGRVRRRFRHDPSDPGTLSDDYVTVIHERADGTLWVGTRSGGLDRIDPRTGRATRYVPDPADASSISHHSITAILEDRSGRLWVATAGGGLNQVEEDAASGRTRFRRVTVADGLVDSNVMSILEDDDGSLWLGTKRGLSRYSPEAGTFANYLVPDGLPSGEFEFRSSTRTRDRLIFGSVQWLAAIPTGTVAPPAAPSPTVLTAVQRRGDETRAATASRPPERLEVPYGEGFTIEIAVLDYRPEHRHAYAYRLAEGDAPWIELGSRRSITVTDLAPGSYRLAARGRNARGVWTESPHLEVVIVPPFWMTAWFRLLALAAAGASLVAIHQVRLSRLERRNRELLTLQEARERANRELAVAYERLQALTRRFEAAKEEERKHIARELHDDLGPNLTAVNINLRLLRAHPGDERAARRFEDTVDLVDRMVQQIRDLSLDLRPPLLDEMGLVTALKGYLETQAERSGLVIDVDAGSLPDALPPELEIAAFRTAQEAVTNAIRHAEARRVSVSVRARDALLEIDVEDDGRGFDPGRVIDAPASGKSVGVLGMQERARMLGGTFEIDSAPGRGTRVRIRIPMEGRR